MFLAKQEHFDIRHPFLINSVLGSLQGVDVNVSNVTNSTTSSLEEETLLSIKLTTLFGILLGSFLSGIVPIFFARVPYLKKKINQNWLSIILDQCNGFAGGVLFAGGLLHLMAEGSDVLKEGLTELGDTSSAEYPLSPLVMCLAFLLLYGMEFVVLAFFSAWFKSRSAKQSTHSHSHSHDHSHSHSHSHAHKHHGHECTTDDKLTSTCENVEMNETVTNCTIPKSECQTVTPSNDVADLEDPKPHKHTHSHDHGDHTACAHHEATTMLFETNYKSGIPLLLTSFVLWLALSAHSIFIGLGFGAETDMTRIWGIFAAIVAHQFIEAFSLGSIVEKGCKSIWVALSLLFLYAIAVPSGIAIGLGIVYSVKHQGGEGDALSNPKWLVSQGILMSLAAGAFIYVSLLEIAIHQPKNKYLKLSRFTLMIIGFAAMSILAIWA